MRKRAWIGILLMLVVAILSCALAEEKAEIQSGDWVYSRSGDAAVLVRYTGSETEVTVPDTIDGLPVVSLGWRYGFEPVFPEATRYRIRSVHLPDSLLMIGRNAFSRCENLEEVNIPSRIMTIQEGTFLNTGLKHIDLPEGLREIGRYAFQGTPLTEIRLPASVQWIQRYAFQNCRELKEISWPTGNIFLQEGAFWNTGIPEEKFSLPEQYADYTNRYYFYTPAEAVGTMEISEQVVIDYVRKPDGTIGIIRTRVFDSTPKSLTLPDRIEGLPVTGYYGPLEDDYERLEALVIPDSITEIGDMALNHLRVHTLTLPRKLIRIGNEALSYCENLKEVKLPATLRKLGGSAFFYSGTDRQAFEENLKQQRYDLGIYESSVNHLGSIGHYYDYDVTLDGMVCELRTNGDSGEMDLLFWEMASGCALRDSPESWRGIPFASVPGDSIRIRDGIAYLLSDDGESLEPIRITDMTGWNWNFPETVDGLPVKANPNRTIQFATDGLLCELGEEDGKKGIRVLQADPEKWDESIPENIGGYPVRWLGRDFTFRADGMVFQGLPYKEKQVKLAECSIQDENISIPATALGWHVSRVETDAFRNLQNLKSVTLPASLEEIGSGAFTDCPALTEIDVQNPNASIHPDAFQQIGTKWLEINDDSYSTAMKQPDKDYALFADGTAEICHWAESGNAVRIPAEIDEHPVVSIADYVFRDRKCTSVDMPDTILRIGRDAFNGCRNLSSIRLSAALEYIGEHAFSSCEKLSAVRFPASLKYIGKSAFYYSGISSVSLAEGLEVISEGAFSNCGKLTSVSLPESLKEIGDEAFLRCEKLSSVKLSQGLEKIGASCFENTGLKKITIPASVQSIGDRCFSKYKENAGWGTWYYDGPEVLFEGDPVVSEKLFGQLDNSPQYSYTEFWDRVELFIGHKIVKLKITTAPGTMVDRIFLSPLVVDKHYPKEKEMAAGETAVRETLEAGDIPAGVQILTVPEGVERIAPEAFKGMHSLYRVILPDSLREIGDSAFEDCGGLQYISFGSGLETLGKRAFAGCRNLREAMLPEGIKEIPEYCFEKDINLKKVKLPKGLITIHQCAFMDCCYLEEADFGPCTALESIGENAFHRSAIKKITLPDSVRSLGPGAFAYPIGMTALKLSEGLEEIPENCFYHCNKLKSLKIPGKIRAIGDYAFYQARSMNDLTLPEGLETIGEGAFSTFYSNVLTYNVHGRRYSSLKAIKLPAALRTLGTGAFAGCDAVTSVTFGKNGALTEIPESCFLLCTALQKIQIPGYIRKIGDTAFAGCSSLSAVTVEEGVTDLGSQAFLSCGKLKKVELPASLENIGEKILEETGKGVTVTVCSGSSAEDYLQKNYPDVRITIRK